MLIKFNSGHNREAKSLYKLIKVPVPRPLRIPESGEIRLLSSFRKAGFPPFTVVVVFFSGFLSKMAVSDVSQKYDVILRIFKFSLNKPLSFLFCYLFLNSSTLQSIFQSILSLVLPLLHPV